MVEFSKKNPGKIRLGTVGAGSVGHFTLEMINSLTGAGLTMVPFKGASPGVTAILGGHVEGGVLALGTLVAHVKSGGMKGILTSSKIPEYPEIPTLTETSLASGWPFLHLPECRRRLRKHWFPLLKRP